jgi:hypothetical protein
VLGSLPGCDVIFEPDTIRVTPSGNLVRAHSPANRSGVELQP